MKKKSFFSKVFFESHTKERIHLLNEYIIRDYFLHINHRCRWANEEEAKSAQHSEFFDSIWLDGEKCVLHYNENVDQTTSGVKPIAIQVEDFETSGRIRSSIPIQLLATVWTPENSNFNTRVLGKYGPGDIVPMPSFFPEDLVLGFYS